MKIILLRHGETIWNIEHRLQGCRDIPLIASGAEQITRTGNHLSAVCPTFDLIVSSPLQRAKKSAEIIAALTNYPIRRIVTEPLFTERRFGAGEGLTYDEAHARYPDSNYPGMETLEEVCARARMAIHKYVTESADRNILVVAHGAIIKAALVALTDGHITYFDQKVWIENGSYCQLDYSDGQWRISFHNASDNYTPLLLQ